MQIQSFYKYKKNDPVRCKFIRGKYCRENIPMGKILPWGAELSNLQYEKYGKGRITGLLLLTHQNCGDWPEILWAAKLQVL